MLFIDQPVQVGYSYDTLHNGTKDLASANEMDEEEKTIELDDFIDGHIPEQNNTFLYKPHDEKIGLWTESYGGKYGPAFMSFFSHQNEGIRNGTISGPGTHYLHLDTLGIVNGCIDQAHCTAGYASMLVNNTYGIKAVNETFHHKQMYEMERPDGIFDQIEKCQDLSHMDDPDEYGDIDEVNEFCKNISAVIEELFIAPYMADGNYGWFDITHPAQDPFPHMYEVGFLNQHWVQKALGVPVNHSWVAESVSAAFSLTGDINRGDTIEDIAYLLDNGVKVALVYGDRDYACNWINGETTSISIPYTYLPSFTAAGYEPLTVSSPETPPFISYGLARQHGNFSFTRVFQAGHMVPSYQPEASYQIFKRALFNLDIASGSIDLTKTGGWSGMTEDVEIYSTKGSQDTWWRRNEIMPAPEHECYVLVPSVCTDEQREALKNGTAIVKDWIVIGIEGDENTEGGIDHDTKMKEDPEGRQRLLRLTEDKLDLR
ncbi:putative carboxypeptidase 1 [Phaeomoniella chlamydospora]|uniref:Putative carboxypeptidase 1 n=1 Tax=Phaeomoniella chlamydospora TaxID=158046 RepID=A0A0G2ELH2_PHACM|nr:putative carboxypeptidase 1 [Phaeomoniella chlamydospora]